MALRRSPGKLMPALAYLGLLLVAPALAEPGTERTLNGFALSPSLIPADEVLPGGPPRDGIPALDHPALDRASEAVWPDEARVVGVEIGGIARAYPVALLDWHELVNDELAGVPILVSYCPLCGTALVFDRRLDGKALQFGVSGLLHKSDLLMFDRATGSLWSQVMAKAVTGAHMGRRLELVRSRIEPWGRWRSRYPDSTALSPRTGHRRPYGRSPYGDYATSAKLYFPVDVDHRFPPKTPTVGLRTVDGAARAYTRDTLRAAGGQVAEYFEGHAVEVRYDARSGSFEVKAPPDVEVVEGYWFAWAAFHPGTTVFEITSGTELQHPTSRAPSPPD